MKKHLLQSLLAVALLLVCGNVWGTEKTVNIDFSSQGYSNAQAIESACIDDNVTVTFDNGTNSNVPKYYETGTAIRCYGGNSFTVSTNSGSITKINLTFGSGDGSNTICSNVGNLNTSEWSGSSKSVTFTIDGTSGHRRIQGISVTYTPGEGGDTPTKTLESIAVSGTPTKISYYAGDTFDPAGLVVTGTYDDGTTDDVTSECTFSCTPATLTLGTTSVAVKVTCNSIESAIVNINISVSAATEYCLVTDANNLRSGDVIVLGCADKQQAAGVFDDKTFFTSVNATIANGVLTSEDAIEITLGGIVDAWTLTTSEGQITASKAKALKLNDGTQKTCSISIDENNNASITYGSYGSIQYNSSSPRFLNYTSPQTAIQIYKKVINTQDITISSVGWATACVPFTATVSGATAYTAKVEDDALVMTPITVIPAGTGVLLESVNGATTATFTESGLEGDDVNGNQLRGNATDAAVTWSNEVGATAIFTYYIFANDAEDGLGFYWQKDTGGSSVSCGAYKAALVVPGAPTTEPAVIGYRLDGTTMVEQLLQESSDATIYDLQGRKVENATKGLYIIGGKKVMVK